MSELVLERGVDQPPVRFDARVAAGIQVGDQHPPRAQGATADVQQPMVLAQPQGIEQRELSRADQVVLAGGPHEGPVVLALIILSGHGPSLDRP